MGIVNTPLSSNNPTNNQPVSNNNRPVKQTNAHDHNNSTQSGASSHITTYQSQSSISSAANIVENVKNCQDNILSLSSGLSFDQRGKVKTSTSQSVTTMNNSIANTNTYTLSSTTAMSQTMTSVTGSRMQVQIPSDNKNTLPSASAVKYIIQQKSPNAVPSGHNALINYYQQPVQIQANQNIVQLQAANSNVVSTNAGINSLLSAVNSSGQIVLGECFDYKINR